MMGELLARKTSIPVKIAENDMQVVRDHIYLLPPKKEMIISDDRLLLTERESSGSLSLPINTFFRSLAESGQDKSIAIVLSGTGSDGSSGVPHIHDVGGFVVAQKPESCKFDSMPKNSISTGKVDLIIEPSEIPEALIRYSKRTNKVKQHIDLGHLDVEESRFAEIILVLNNRFGLDFSQYKPSTITRRLERRLAIQKVSNLQEYINIILSDADELEKLYFDLLIGVTEFFRDRDHFEALEHSIPKLLEDFPEEKEFRIWVPGCATGQEAYSLAMLFYNYFEKNKVEIPFKIFATDIHRNSIATATAGIYPSCLVSKLPHDFANRFFRIDGNNLQIIPEIRKKIVFAPHNLLKDPPFTKMHLISCRNLLIYFNQQAQQRVFSLISFSLNNKGLLFLGPSETLGSYMSDFSYVNQNARILRKTRETKNRPQIEFSSAKLHVGTSRSNELRYVDGSKESIKSRKALEILLQEYVPPSVLMDSEGHVLHIFGNTHEFLTMDAGVPSLSIRSMMRGSAKSVVTQLLQHVKKNLKPTKTTGVSGFQKSDQVTIEVRPLSYAAPDLEYVLISFFDDTEKPWSEPVSEASFIYKNEGQQIGDLEEELKFTKESLQAAIEELETSNEELQASNEELMASNEELQSTNEELQSVNEELFTVNSEYQMKEKEKAVLEEDEKSILESSGLGIIFLDQNLCVRKFSSGAKSLFELLDTDHGRPLRAIKSLIVEDISSSIKSALEDSKTTEMRVRDEFGSTFQIMIHPHTSSDTLGTAPGVVLSFLNVTEMQSTQDNLRLSESRMENALNCVADGYLEYDLDSKKIFFNEKWLKSLGYFSEAPPDWQTLLGDQESLFMNQVSKAVKHKTKISLALDIIKQDGTSIFFLFRGGGSPSEDENKSLLSGVFIDIDDLKKAELDLAEANQELMRSNKFLEQFAYIVSHDLKAPLRHSRCYISFLEEALEAGDKDTMRQEMKHLVDTTDRLESLVNDIIIYSRISSSKADTKVVCLKKVMENTIETLRPVIEARNARIQIGDLPRICGDKTLLEQLFQNLISNACKYCDKEVPEVRINHKELKTYYEISVCDNGIGIEQEHSETIFEPFKRLVSKDKYEGRAASDYPLQR